MKNENDIIFRTEGKVIESLPDNKCRVLLKNNKIILAYLSGNMIKNFIKVIKGDIVIVEINFIDLNKGRIVIRK